VPGVTAVVVTHDSAAVLPDCLAALAREHVPALVVDNASGDGSARIAEAAGARVLRNARNEGYGRANDRGIREARGDFALVVNPDVTLRPGCADALLAAAERYPDAALLAPRIVEPDGRLFYQPRSLLAPYLTNPSGRRLPPDGDACAPFLSGACLLVRRAAYLALGGFDPNIFLFYEDDDLCRRAAEAGHALVHVHGAEALHRRGGSSAGSPERVFTTRWHQAWSRAYVTRKYGLPDPTGRDLRVNAVKAGLSCLTLNRTRIARYAGTAAGALAARSGRTALEREDLPATTERARSDGVG
jgi:N-acetylglucosaminyl-diphospho-decaprenol L-rhamnosyltransferase